MTMTMTMIMPHCAEHAYVFLLKLCQHSATMAYLCYMCEQWRGDDNQWQYWYISSFFFRETNDIPCYFDELGSVWFYQCHDCHEQAIEEKP